MSQTPDEFLAAKILVIDDNAANVLLLEGILDEAGYENVVSTNDPRQVLSLYQEHGFDLILLDIRMPHMDGYQVMAALRQAAGDDYLPILVISAQTDQETRHRALDSGAKDFINKPFDQTEVLQRIRNMLEVRLAYNERRNRAARLEEEVRKRTAEIAAQREHLKGITETAAEIIVSAWEDGRIETFNRAAREHFLYGDEDLPKLALSDLIDLPGWVATPGDSEVPARRKDGSSFPMEVSIRRMEVTGSAWLVMVGRDVTQRKRAEAELTWLANHDPLTELPNRAVTLRELARRLADGGTGAVLFLSLRGHQRVADACGHDVGEKLLRAVGERLTEGIGGGGGIVGAWGGGEFAVVLDRPDVDDTAVALCRALHEPFDIDGRELTIRCHVGVSRFPEHGSVAAHLVRCASTAMYFGTKAASARPTVFSPAMDEQTARRHLLEGELRHALARHQFEVFYQPKIDLASGEIVGMEALLRWQHPDLGMVSPVQFIPLAEETGLILPIGEWVLRQACLDTARWNARRARPLTVAVNLSGRQFDDLDLTETVQRIVRDSGLPCPLVELEVTESSLIRDAARSRDILLRFRDMGFGVAIDDFGTGYSSLSQLKHLPLTTLKIDRTFVAGVTDNEDDAAIARMIIDMAQNLRLKVVAEGIETEAHASFLRRLSCDLGQGYLYAKPLPADAFEAFVMAEAAAG